MPLSVFPRLNPRLICTLSFMGAPLISTTKAFACGILIERDLNCRDSKVGAGVEGVSLKR